MWRVQTLSKSVCPVRCGLYVLIVPRSQVRCETGHERQNIEWKVDLPGPGSSSPIVSGDRVFMTCYSGCGVDRSNPGDQDQLTRHLVCLNLKDGEVLWQKSVSATEPEDDFLFSPAC